MNTLLRRDKQGRLPLRDAGLRATDALTRAQIPNPPFFDDPLDAIAAAGEDTKRLALFLLYQATERLGDAFGETQEIVAAIADVICAAYALESVSLRCRKLQTRGAAHYDTALLAAQVAARDYADEALAGARYALDALPSLDDVVDWRDEPFTGIAALLDRLGRWEASPLQLRRDLAAEVIEKEGYPL